jgi:hypothetical protein
VPRALTEAELVTLLDEWRGHDVAVRVIDPNDNLVAVFTGRIGERTDARHPSVFWPLGDAPEVVTAERSGLYVHSGLVKAAVLHDGDWVAEWRQSGVIVNVRRL